MNQTEHSDAHDAAIQRYPDNTHLRRTPYYASIKREAFVAGVEWAREGMALTPGQLLAGFQVALRCMEAIEEPGFSDRLALESLRVVIADLSPQPSDPS